MVCTVAAGAGSGAFIDVRTRRVPNMLTGALAAVGLVLAATGATGVSVRSSLAGLVLGLVLMLPGHVFGALGPGDVKLFAAAGAVLGVGRVVPAFVYAALAGGVIAVIVAVHRRRLKQAIAATAMFVATRGANSAQIESPQTNNRFAYAPAIAIGVLLAALVTGV